MGTRVRVLNIATCSTMDFTGLPSLIGGGGVQQQKRQRTSCDFPGGMIFFVLFCSLFEDILLTKSGKNNKKEQKRT